MSHNEEDLIDYSDEELQTTDAVATGAPGAAANGEQKKGDLTVTGGTGEKFFLQAPSSQKRPSVHLRNHRSKNHTHG